MGECVWLDQAHLHPTLPFNSCTGVSSKYAVSLSNPSHKQSRHVLDSYRAFNSPRAGEKYKDPIQGFKHITFQSPVLRCHSVYFAGKQWRGRLTPLTSKII